MIADLLLYDKAQLEFHLCHVDRSTVHYGYFRLKQYKLQYATREIYCCLVSALAESHDLKEELIRSIHEANTMLQLLQTYRPEPLTCWDPLLCMVVLCH